jgi:hypothetical protein
MSARGFFAQAAHVAEDLGERSVFMAVVLAIR